MERLRTNCPSLNFFTTEQLVSLSKELAKLNNDKKSSLDSQALMMLRLVAPKANDKTLIKFVVDHLKAFTHDAFNEASSDDMEVEIEEQDDADDLPGTDFENHQMMKLIEIKSCNVFYRSFDGDDGNENFQRHFQTLR